MMGASGDKVLLQVAALPVRFSDNGAIEVLLITTRTTKRWTVPKGWPIKGLTAHQVAAKEAGEEAGVVGKVRKRPIGTYLYWKRFENNSCLCRVKLFLMTVKGNLPDWPERTERRQQWFRFDDAADLVGEPGLALLLKSLKLTR